jgi:hypothetical protein
MNELTLEVREALESSAPIPRERVRQWMGASDLETRALVYKITDKGWCRIAPELTAEEQCEFMARYLIDCIEADRQDREIVHSGFEAAWEFAGWLKHLHQIGADHGILRRAVAALEGLYRRSDPRTRNRIETGAVEHVLESKPLRTYFEHWAHDPELSAGYEMCLKWGKAHEQ